MNQQFYSNGKLLLTGEYAVLDGALALAVPTQYGQSLTVNEQDSGDLFWTSYDEKESVWFKAHFNLPDLKMISTSNNEMGTMLQKLLLTVQSAKPGFLKTEKGASITTNLSFPKDWGLGTSSTLINNIAAWAMVNPFFLLQESFGGSGYDIACAQHNTPITYQLQKESRKITSVDFNPIFKDHLYFVYLNRKQNSRDAIKNYREKAFDQSLLIKSISLLTEKVVKAQTLSDFESLLKEHEVLLSETLQIKTIQEQLFPDYKKGVIKSLGGWGGDFVLVTGDEKTPEFFKSKGFDVVISYEDMILRPS